MYQRKLEKDIRCPLEYGMEIFGGKWNSRIICANGIVARKSYDEIPPRVEYSLTEKGASVMPILQSICQWAGVFYKDAGETPMVQCQKCDHR